MNLTDPSLLFVRIFVLFAAGFALWLLETRRPFVRQTASNAHDIRANLSFSSLTIFLNAAFGIALSTTIAALAADGPGLLGRFEAPGWLEVSFAIVALDFFAYMTHRSLHFFGAGWRIHRVHHSDPHVDVTTALRQHPLENAWRYGFQFAGIALTGAAPAAVALYGSLSALNALLEHANIALPRRLDAALRQVFVTPAVHKIHHSRHQPETDSNYGNLFSIWDRIFRTFRAPDGETRIRYGLDGYDAPGQQKFGALLRLPLRAALVTTPLRTAADHNISPPEKIA